MQFTVLPPKLNNALCIFTKMARPLAQTTSSLKVEVLMYLNNLLIQAMKWSVCKVHRGLTLKQANQMGFLFNLAKSHLTPIQTVS